MLSFCISFVLFTYGCNKQGQINYENTDASLTYFENLSSDKDTIYRGQTAIITAIVIGRNVTYLWSASVGPIIGEGSQVLYVASPCCDGNVRITCEAKAGKESATKSIVITILK
jgi:hypothetical protein